MKVRFDCFAGIDLSKVMAWRLSDCGEILYLTLPGIEIAVQEVSIGKQGFALLHKHLMNCDDLSKTHEI